MDLMVDIETLSTNPDATILTIGAVNFEPITGEIYGTYYARLDLESQEGRHIDDATVEWWSQQNAAAQEEAFGESGTRIPLRSALEDLHKMAWQSNRCWANGIAFDYTILENAYKWLGMGLPWQYYKVMDARTVYKLANAGKLGNSHNAMEDCVNQIALLKASFEKLGIKSL